MHRLHTGIAAVAIAMAFGSTAMAQGMSKEAFKSARDGIAAEYKAAKKACANLAGNAEDICEAEASGEEKIARADLDAAYKPSREATYEARVARADADLAVAKERCDDSAGNVKDVCLKEAEAASVAAKSAAKARMKTSDANARGADARSDAADETRDANYATAVEKCDAFAGDAKSSCVAQAKSRFGKS